MASEPPAPGPIREGREPTASAAVPPGAADAASPPWFRRLTFWSLLAGLCPLIPIPFLDDWAVRRLRRWQVADQLRSWRLPATGGQVAILAGQERGLASGCLSGAGVALFVKLPFALLKKLFRKIALFFLAKDCADRLSESFHEGLLLHHACAGGHLAAPTLDDAPRLRAIRAAIEAASRDLDPRPLNQLVARILRGSRQLLREAARMLARLLRRERRRARRAPAKPTAAGPKPAAALPGPREGASRAGEAAAPDPEAATALAAEERFLAGVLDRLTAALWHQEGYRTHLEARFAAALAATEGPRQGAGAPQSGGPPQGVGAP